LEKKAGQVYDYDAEEMNSARKLIRLLTKRFDEPNKRTYTGFGLSIANEKLAKDLIQSTCLQNVTILASAFSETSLSVKI